MSRGSGRAAIGRPTRRPVTDLRSQSTQGYALSVTPPEGRDPARSKGLCTSPGWQKHLPRLSWPLGQLREAGTKTDTQGATPALPTPPLPPNPQGNLICLPGTQAGKLERRQRGRGEAGGQAVRRRTDAQPEAPECPTRTVPPAGLGGAAPGSMAGS